jgi:hypothetical protein
LRGLSPREDRAYLDPSAFTAVRDEQRRRRQRDENLSIQDLDAGAMIPSELSVGEMRDRCVFLASGQRVAYVTEDRSMFLKYDEFARAARCTSSLFKGVLGEWQPHSMAASTRHSAESLIKPLP